MKQPGVGVLSHQIGGVVDLVAIQNAIGSLKAAADIARSLVQMKSMADVQAKVIELQGALLEAQSSALSATASQFELVEKVRNLETQLKAKADWETQAGRYSLVNPWRGAAQAYALKREAAEGEKAHLICTNCFHNSRKVILNPVPDKNGLVQMVCPTCKATTDTGYRGIGAPKYAEDYANS